MKYLTNILQSSNGKFKNASYLLPAGCMHNSSGYKIVKLLDAWWHPEGSYEIGSVHSSIPPNFSGYFVGIGSSFFPNFIMALEIDMTQGWKN